MVYTGENDIPGTALSRDFRSRLILLNNNGLKKDKFQFQIG